MHRALTSVGLGIGLIALALQLRLTIPARLDGGDSLLGAVVFFLSFFTILTNIGLVLVYTAALAPRALPMWFGLPSSRAMLAALILLVMAVYHFVLAENWAPVGWFHVADVMLHYLTPIFYLIWWVLAPRKDIIGFGAIPRMIVVPIVYVVYIFIRGAIVDEYPYPFLDLNQFGPMTVAMNILVIVVLMTVLFLLAIIIENTLVRLRDRSS